jgi:hypothetical protein
VLNDTPDEDGIVRISHKLADSENTACTLKGDILRVMVAS